MDNVNNLNTATRRAVIFTALPVEYKAVRAHLSDITQDVYKGTVYEKGVFVDNGRRWEVGIVEVGAGNPMAAATVERAIGRFDPEVVLFVGVAGGIKDVKLGDVVAATKVYGYESGKDGSKFRPRPEMGRAAYALVQKARAVSRDDKWCERICGDKPIENPTVYVAPIVAGEKIIASKRSSAYKLIKSNYNDALAVEMEGYGFLRAVHANRDVDGLVIRGISDLISGKKNADASGSQDRASRYAAAFAFVVLATLEGVSPAPPDVQPITSLHNQTPPEPRFVGRDKVLDEITKWYGDTSVRVGALIAWGGEGKSTIARKWFDLMEENSINPKGVFWWGFYRNADLERFVQALYTFLGGDALQVKDIWQRVDHIKAALQNGEYLLVLDGLEEMQESKRDDSFGQMLHLEFTELLHGFADSIGKGLCLITTRFTMADLENYLGNGYDRLELQSLEPKEAKELLRSKGIKGDDEEIELLIENFKGHALSLASIIGYLKRYCDSKASCAREIKYEQDDERRWKDVNKLLKRYTKKMSEAEVAFMKLFSLFREEIGKRDFDGVFRKPIKGSGISRPLVEMENEDFIDLVSGLVDWRLIYYDDKADTYSTHPLLKGYFEELFEEEDKKLCHKAIYRHIDSYAPKDNANHYTPEEMRPLFEMVYHCCQAGMYPVAYHDVYHSRIKRGEDAFLTHKLGLWGMDVELIRNFFLKGEFEGIPLVERRESQSYLLNSAGLGLIKTGKPGEAEKLLIRTTKMYIDDENWAFASTGHINLTDLLIRTGRLKEAEESASKARYMAEKAMDKNYQITPKAYIAFAAFLMHDMERAGQLFKEADELERKLGRVSGLYSLPGVFYADLLLASNRTEDALEVTERNLELCHKQTWINSVPCCQRSMGAVERKRKNLDKAGAYIEEALSIARSIGMPDIEMEALIERARLRLDLEDFSGAASDCKTVLKIVDRTGFRLYAPEARMVLARVRLAEGKEAEARDLANDVQKEAAGMAYNLIANEAADFLSSTTP